MSQLCFHYPLNGKVDCTKMDFQQPELLAQTHVEWHQPSHAALLISPLDACSKLYGC